MARRPSSVSLGLNLSCFVYQSCTVSSLSPRLRLHADERYRYGPAPLNKDSAVNILLDVVADQSGKQYNMDHFATRFPTNVLDIADFLVRLTSTPSFPFRGDSWLIYRTTFAALPSSRAIPPILHYSAAEPFTKYEMCLIFAKILGVPRGHIIADAEAPKVCFA